VAESAKVKGKVRQMATVEAEILEVDFGRMQLAADRRQ